MIINKKNKKDIYSVYPDWVIETLAKVWEISEFSNSSTRISTTQWKHRECFLSLKA